MFENSLLRAALTASFIFASPLSTAMAADASSCDMERANYALSFGQGFGWATCQNPQQRGLLIIDRNLSTEKQGVVALIVSNDDKLIRFWHQLIYWGADSQCNPELLELGGNYYKQSNQTTLKALTDYIHEIQKKLNSPHGKNTKVIKCESYQREDQYCETGIDLTESIDAEISVSELYSRDKCTLGESFKLLGADLHVSKGCRASFTIKY